MTAHDVPSARLVSVIRQAYGLDLGGHRKQDLLECLAAVDTDIEKAADALLRASPAQLGELVECTTNNETYFFRHAEQLVAVREMVAASLARFPRASLRVWVAGCSSGEEPLSLAMVLREALITAPGTQLSVLGTDLNRVVLRKAKQSQYTAWSFRGVPPEVKAAHFVAHDGFHEPSEALRSVVSYRRHNLLEGPPESQQFDVVSCRNVLIYFEAKMIQRALDLLALAVAPGGLLLLGPAESPNVTLPEFETVFHGGVSIFRRKSGLTLPPPALSKSSADPSAPRPPRELADGLSRSHSRSLALRAERKSLSIRPVAPEARIEHPTPSVQVRVEDALLALEQGDPNGALEHLDAAVGAEPDCAMAHYLIGTTLESRGEQAAAEQSFGRALVALEGQEPTAMAPYGGGVTVEELVRVIASILESYRSKSVQ